MPSGYCGHTLDNGSDVTLLADDDGGWIRLTLLHTESSMRRMRWVLE